MPSPASAAIRWAPASPQRNPDIERRADRVLVARKPRRSRRWPYIVGVVILALLAADVWRKNRANREEVQDQAAGIADEKVQRFRFAAEAEFRSADANSDGYLSIEEMRNRFPFPARDFKRLDGDGDGRISQREYLQAKRAMLERKFAK